MNNKGGGDQCQGQSVWLQMKLKKHLLSCISWLKFLNTSVHVHVGEGKVRTTKFKAEKEHNHIKIVEKDKLKMDMTQQSYFWAYTPRKPDLKETRAPQCSSQHCL